MPGSFGTNRGRCTLRRRLVCDECGAIEDCPFNVEKKAKAYLGGKGNMQQAEKKKNVTEGFHQELHMMGRSQSTGSRVRDYGED
jgi:hypothetical protein